VRVPDGTAAVSVRPHSSVERLVIGHNVPEKAECGQGKASSLPQRNVPRCSVRKSEDLLMMLHTACWFGINQYKPKATAAWIPSAARSVLGRVDYQGANGPWSHAGSMLPRPVLYKRKAPTVRPG